MNITFVRQKFKYSSLILTIADADANSKHTYYDNTYADVLSFEFMMQKSERMQP